MYAFKLRYKLPGRLNVVVEAKKRRCFLFSLPLRTTRQQPQRDRAWFTCMAYMPLCSLHFSAGVRSSNQHFGLLSYPTEK